MPKKAQLLAPEHLAFVTDRYLAGDVPPRDLVRELFEKFGVTVKASALRQKLTRAGLGKRKAALDAKTCSIVSSARVNALAKAKAAEPKKQIERWVERTAAIAEKSFEFAESAERPRELASAVSAMTQSIKVYRLLAGIDGPGTGGARALSFNFAFASMPMPVARAQSVIVPPAIQLTISETPSPGQTVVLEDGDSDDSESAE